ncbi:hypothetical protein NQ315_013434 [Exocentrus adspersus]|uniref:Sugar transporter SWEET1 n=1 Tax=Exocentrus adspersus TaxID=1586481 RepID=A0AAV8VI03_9CUCU|nr:hypothetical protein NQ315_013434 [Exocentrus adspersus]
MHEADLKKYSCHYSLSLYNTSIFDWNTTVIRQFLACVSFLVTTLLYIHRLEDAETAKSHLGLVCCMVTILFFAAPLASLLHVIKVKNTDSLPYHLICATFIVSLQWVIYGIILKDKFIQIPNFLGCVLSAFQLSLFIIYPKNTKTYPNVI